MNTKQQLTELACELFARHGYDAVGVKLIVDGAGVSKPTLYHHFGNKQGLLEAVLAHYLSPYLTQLTEQATYRGDLSQTLKQGLSCTLAFALHQPAAFALLRCLARMPAETVSAQVVRPWQEQQFAHYQQLFERAAEDHGNMRGRARLYAVNFISLSMSWAGLAAQGELVMDDAMLHQVIHSYLHGVYS